MPASHDGSSSFTFELRFSEEVPLSYLTLRDHAFVVTDGRITSARRLEKGSNVRWEISAEPDGAGAVNIVLPLYHECSAERAICTEDGRPLSNQLELVLPGPDQ